MPSDPMSDPRAGQILDIVATESGVERERLVPDARLSDLDIASLDLVQAIFKIEERFNVEIPVAGSGGGAEFETVNDMLRHVLKAMGPA
jgi:acyl carrier protein